MRLRSRFVVGAVPDHVLMRSGQDLDTLAEVAITRNGAVVVPVGADQFRKQLRVPLGSDFAPRVVWRLHSATPHED